MSSTAATPATRLGVLVGDEVEQRTGAHEDDSRADRATLVLERDLRATQRVDARKRPARKGDPVARTGREDDVAIRNLPTAPAGQAVQHTVLQVPDEGIRPIVDVAFDAVERPVQSPRLGRVETVERLIGAGEAGGGTAIDLAAACWRLVEDDRGEACSRQGCRRAAASGTTDDDRRSIFHRQPRSA